MIRRTQTGIAGTLTTVLLVGVLLADSAQRGPVPERFVPQTPAEARGELRWFKGNTHTHSWWSDGDSPPETIVAWYKENGYHFLVLSDHNILSEGEKWIVPTGARVAAAEIYEEAFGSEWVVKRERDDGKIEYLCQPLNEFRAMFEEAGKFLLIQGEEITDSYDGKPVHVNAINIRDYIPPQRGESVQDTIQRNVDAVIAQREEVGQPMFSHIDHPNFRYALRAEDIYPIRGERFFEVYNGHPSVANHGDELHPSTERMWDIILTKRLAELDLPIMFGVATDDAHNFVSWGQGRSNPGRGWVMVRATKLTPAELVLAMERGDFYASSGVVLDDFRFEDDTLTIEIRGESGVRYTTRFIGTREGYDPSVADRTDDPEAWLTRRYSDDIGQVLAEVEGTRPSYTMRGDEYYVRAKVISSQPQPNPFAEGDVEVAWVQPVQPAARTAAAEPDES